MGDVDETDNIEDGSVDNEATMLGSSDANANILDVADAPAENASQEQGNSMESEPAETITNSSADAGTNVAGTSLVTNGYVMVRNERLRLDGSLRSVVQFEVDYENNTLIRSSSYPNGVNDLTVHELFSYCLLYTSPSPRDS